MTLSLTPPRLLARRPPPGHAISRFIFTIDLQLYRMACHTRISRDYLHGMLAMMSTPALYIFKYTRANVPFILHILLLASLTILLDAALMMPHARDDVNIYSS